MILSLFNAAYCFLGLTNQYVCNEIWGQIFSYTVFYSDNSNDIYRATELVTMSFLWIRNFLYGAIVCMECILVADLQLTLAKPFKPPETRYFTFTLTCLTYALLYAIMNAATNYDYTSTVNIVFTATLKGAYFIICIPSIFLTIKTMHKPGLSK